MGRPKQLITAIIIFTAMLLFLLPGCTNTKPAMSPASNGSSAASAGSSEAVSAVSAVAQPGSRVSSAASSYPDYPTQPDRPGKRPNVAYLTFDDGPTEMTPQILDILKEYDVKATFFVVHKNSEKLTSYMKRAYDEGHEIAVHSYTHNYKAIYQSADTFLADFNKTRDWICSVTGQKEPTLQFRFPGGSSISQKYLKKPVLNEILYRMGELHAVHHDWNVSSGDAVNPPINKQQVLDNVMKSAGKFNEPVILMHDVVKNTGTRDALPEIIKLLRERGYTFDTISNIHQPAQHRVYHNTGISSQGESGDPHTSVPSVPSVPPVSSAASSESVSSAVSSAPTSSLPSSSEVIPSSEPAVSSEPGGTSSDSSSAVSSNDTTTSLPSSPD